ncbi:MAG TPA: outer membrane beta-barrel protein [Bacteroidia bacterium]|nr:outer membrane beta-barrel protein [Bacteroidia bacterium]
MNCTSKFFKYLYISGIALVLSNAPVHAQFKLFSEEIRYSLHAKTSVMFSTIKGDYNKREQFQGYKFGPSFGCYLSVALSDQLAVEPGLFLSSKGSRAKLNYTTKISNDELSVYMTERGSEQRDLYYIDIPLMIYYRMESKLSIGAGASGSLLVKANYEQEYTKTVFVENTVTSSEISIKNSNISNFSRIDAAFLFSVGYMLKDGLEVSVNTSSGLMDLMDEKRKFKNSGFGISLAYRFKQL